MLDKIYADYAAATPIDDRVITAISENSKYFGNPSSLHRFGQDANNVLLNSRSAIAKFLHCNSEAITFTGSGTESNNLAILGVARANRSKGNHLITSQIEHPSVLNTFRALERDGFEITYLPVNESGYIVKDELENALRPTTILVSIHLADSEIGVIQNIKELSELTHQKSSAYFHTDACQAAAYVELNVEELGVDLLTFNGTKVYGPKGIAVLYVKTGVDIFPIIYGGGQEKSLRSGTENLPAIAGLATAVEIVATQRSEDSKRIAQLRDNLQEKLNTENITVNVAQSHRLPNHLSITLNQTKESDLVRAMSDQGVAVSSGSACSSKSLEDSHVLTAIGLNSDQINKTLRISLGRNSTNEDIYLIFEAIKTL